MEWSAYSGLRGYMIEQLKPDAFKLQIDVAS